MYLFLKIKHIFLRDSYVCPRCIFIFDSDQAQINSAVGMGHPSFVSLVVSIEGGLIKYHTCSGPLCRNGLQHPPPPPTPYFPFTLPTQCLAGRRLPILAERGRRGNAVLALTASEKLKIGLTSSGFLSTVYSFDK
jgi:hypothetical protein